MSTDQDRDDLLTAVVRSTSRVVAQGTMFSQAVADRLGLATTDVECLQILAESGRLAAGRLAELTGLTSGAVTRMIDRLEQAGYVRRIPDPADRRRVIVEPVPEKTAAIGPFYESMNRAAREAIARYSDQDLSLVRDYLDRSWEVARAETARLRESGGADEGQDSTFTAPLGAVTGGRLVFLSGAPKVLVRGDAGLVDLYRAHFEGPVPHVRVRDGMVTVRYGRFAWFDWRMRRGEFGFEASVHWRRDRGEIVLNTSVPWAIAMRGGASQLTGDLRAIDLRAFELAGGAGKVELTLSRPRAVVPIRVAGGANDVTVHRPAGVAVRFRVSGGASWVTLDGRRTKGVGGVELETAGAGTAAERFEIEIGGGANRVTVDEQ